LYPFMHTRRILWFRVIFFQGFFRFHVVFNLSLKEFIELMI
jgi:hypothetical protein